MCSGLVLISSFISLSVGQLQSDPSFSDWLVHATNTKTIFTKESENIFRLSNGLIHRDFITEPHFGTVDFYSHKEDTSILKALSPKKPD